MQLERLLKSAIVTCLVVSLCGIANADLIPITISDGHYNDYGDSWYLNHEDNEVEPGMVNNQYWDLEGFYMDGTELTMVGGFNFMTGYQGMDGGDIFVDVHGDVDEYGKGYDFVIKMDFNTNDPLSSTYEIYSIDEYAVLGKVYLYNFPESNPFNYISGGTELFTNEELGFSFETESDDYLGLKGYNGNNNHHVVSGIDLAFLKEDYGYDKFWLHYTVECGNDMHRAHHNIPEPGTFSLLFMGSICMMGFWALRRRRKNNK